MEQKVSRPLVSVGRVGLEKRGPPPLTPLTSRSSGWQLQLDGVERVVDDRQLMWRRCHFILVEHEATQLPDVEVIIIAAILSVRAKPPAEEPLLVLRLLGVLDLLALLVTGRAVAGRGGARAGGGPSIRPSARPRPSTRHSSWWCSSARDILSLWIRAPELEKRRGYKKYEFVRQTRWSAH